ncbi:MAG: phosphotransferase [Sandaracinaceae bacterium]
MLDWIRAHTGASHARRGERLQSLWSGYGEIVRVHLEGAAADCVILKRVAPPQDAMHPRGWSSDRSHERKLRSYEVEAAFYRKYAARSAARVPRCLATEAHDNGWWFLLEDLDDAGFAGRRRNVDDVELGRCVDWLADFHAGFLGTAADPLWPIGTYWHLETRPDELAAMPDGPLRDAAAALDAALSRARHQTLVHGDAKLANFCFADDAVAAVDFQYTGRGCGMKDVAYLLSCLPEHRCAASADAVLDRYFARLRRSLPSTTDADALETEWRALYPVAWADFERFLCGWAPSHPKRHGYAARLTERALESLM